MKTIEFLDLLKEQSDKSLLFEYQEGKFVGANYHITEVKNITIDSVDCGAGTDYWKETIIQLWESPEEKEKQEFMSTYKALGILNKVDRVKTMVKEAEVKFEYSNSHFHTAQLFVNDYALHNDQLILKLGVQKTDCKAKEACGITMVSRADANACAPGGGCC